MFTSTFLGKNPLTRQIRCTFNLSRANLNGPIRNTYIVFSWNQSETILLQGYPELLISLFYMRRRALGRDCFSPGGVGHGPRDQFCPITSLQMADRFFLLCAGSLFDSLLFSPFNKWFTIIFFGKVWVDRCSKPQFLKQYDVCLFSIDIVRCNSSCA